MDVPTPPSSVLHARDEGTGPTIVFLHGVGGNHTVWNAVLPHLTRRFRTIAPDLRGHGRSPAPPLATYAFDELEADVWRLLDSKGIGPVHFVGLSAGALLALRMALDRPSRVRSLTLIGGSVYTDSHTRAIVQRWADAYAEGGSEALSLRLLKDLYYPDWIEAHMDVADQLRDQMAREDFRAPALWAREAAAFDERARIAQLGCPTLIIQAMDDQVVDPAHGRILRQSVQHAKLRILAQTGHLVPVERPDEVAESIGALVTDAESALTKDGPAAAARP